MDTRSARNITLLRVPVTDENSPHMWLFWQLDGVWWSAHFLSTRPVIGPTEFIHIDSWKLLALQEWEWSSSLELANEVHERDIPRKALPVPMERDSRSLVELRRAFLFLGHMAGGGFW